MFNFITLSCAVCLYHTLASHPCWGLRPRWRWQRCCQLLRAPAQEQRGDTPLGASPRRPSDLPQQASISTTFLPLFRELCFSGSLWLAGILQQGRPESLKLQGV